MTMILCSAKLNILRMFTVLIFRDYTAKWLLRVFLITTS